jgi:hypothetical protein
MRPSSKRQTWEETQRLLQKKLGKKLLSLDQKTTTIKNKASTATNVLLTPPSKPLAAGMQSDSGTKQQISPGDTSSMDASTRSFTANPTTPETSDKVLLTPMTKARDPKIMTRTPSTLQTNLVKKRRGINRPSSGIYSQTESRTVEYDKLVRFASEFPGPNHYQLVHLPPISSPSSSRTEYQSSLVDPTKTYRPTKSRLTKESQEGPGPGKYDVVGVNLSAPKSFNRGYNSRTLEDRMEVDRMNGFGGMGMCGRDNGIPSGSLLVSSMIDAGKTFNVKDTNWL